MRFVPVVLTLLLVSALPAAAVDFTETQRAVTASSSPVQPPATDNTSAVLTLDGAVTADLGEPSTDLGTALAMDRAQFKSKHEQYTLDAQLAAAQTREHKKQILFAFNYQIQSRVLSLQSSEQELRNRFHNQTISEVAFLRELALLSAEAEEVRTLTAAMNEQANQIPQFLLEDERNKVLAELLSLEGPIRDHLVSSLRGQTSPERVYVEASDSGVVLAAIIDGTYVREVYRADLRDPSKQNRLSLRQASFEFIPSQYPWATDNPTKTESIRYSPTNVYRILTAHPHGELITYVDAGTERVFREVQRKSTFGDQRLPAGPSVHNNTSALNLTVNRTYAGGPLRVHLTNATGAPRNGTVMLDDEFVGYTGDDGVLWAVAPGEQFTVRAIEGTETVTLGVRPVALGSES